MYPKETVVAEFAGRDSLVAIIKAFEEEDINYIFPVASMAPTEYGEISNLEENYRFLKARVKELYGDKKTLLPIEVYSDNKLWKELAGNNIGHIIEEFGFYTPCIACHMYFHLLKIPYANKYSKRIVSGERVSHEGVYKINQSDMVIGKFKNILSQLEIELITPVKDIEDNREIIDILGIDKDIKHLTCAFSGNYVDNSRVFIDEKYIEKYIDNDLYKKVKKFLKDYE